MCRYRSSDMILCICIYHTIYHMRCGEHTLQLGIRDVLKKGRAEKFLTKLRKLAQQLRLPHTDRIPKVRANKGMLIDMPTHWWSTFLMLQRLADLKCFVQDLGSHKSYLTESEWAEVKMVVEVLQYLTQQQFIFKNKISLREKACFFGEKAFSKWRSWITILLLLLPPPYHHAKSLYCGKKLSWQLFG